MYGGEFPGMDCYDHTQGSGGIAQPLLKLHSSKFFVCSSAVTRRSQLTIPVRTGHDFLANMPHTVHSHITDDVRRKDGCCFCTKSTMNSSYRPNSRLGLVLRLHWAPSSVYTVNWVVTVRVIYDRLPENYCADSSAFSRDEFWRVRLDTRWEWL